MKATDNKQDEMLLQTECGKKYDSVFKTIKLIQDEQHTFHIVYRTYSDEYIYSFCNPFQDTFTADTYRLISESEAKHIFLHRLSQANARELFSTAQASHN